MSIAEALCIAGGVFGFLGGIAAWVARTVVLDRLTSLEQSRDGMGSRFGEGQKADEIWRAQWDAVQLDRQGRWPR